MPYKGNGGPKTGKHAPLQDEIANDGLAQGKGRTKKRERQPAEDEFMTDAMSNKVLLQARRQLEEVEGGDGSGDAGRGDVPIAMPTLGRALLQATIHEEDDDSEDDEDDPARGGGGGGVFGTDDVDGGVAGGAGKEDYYDDIDISPEDERALAAFMQPKSGKERTLADIILEKIKEKEQGGGGGGGGTGGGGGMDDGMAVPEGIDEKVVEVYRQVGDLLRRYTTGKVPKAFKIIPALSNWEEVLYLTNPEKWSPHAMYQATRLFASNLNAKMAQRFYSLVLLPRVRDDIAEHKRLHFALYQALKKATFKPAAFYKGILIPLCASRTCTLREAVVLSSVLTRGSIPMLHSAAALLKLAELQYAGTTSFFLRVLLDKKYALPFRVIDALVDHFLRFRQETRALPVVWHQSLLCFVQRYKNEIRAEDKTRLRKLADTQHHYQISPEAKRELSQGRSRGEKEEEGAGAGAGVGAGGSNGRKGAGVVGLGGFSVATRAKAVMEHPRDMPSVPMLGDDDY
jgi:essential nuclear protein 1